MHARASLDLPCTSTSDAVPPDPLACPTRGGSGDVGKKTTEGSIHGRWAAAALCSLGWDCEPNLEL